MSELMESTGDTVAAADRPRGLRVGVVAVALCLGLIVASAVAFKVTEPAKHPRPVAAVRAPQAKSVALVRPAATTSRPVPARLVVGDGQPIAIGAGAQVTIRGTTACVGPVPGLSIAAAADVPTLCRDAADPNLALAMNQAVITTSAWGHTTLLFGVTTNQVAAVTAIAASGVRYPMTVASTVGSNWHAVFVEAPFRPFNVSSSTGSSAFPSWGIALTGLNGQPLPLAGP